MEFEPDPNNVFLGDEFEVQIVAQIYEPIIGWGLDLDFDENALTLIGDPVIGPLWTPVTTADGDGLAGAAFPDPVVGENILLATLTFTANELGWFTLLLSTTKGDLTEGFPTPEPGVFVHDVKFVEGMVDVFPQVPEPTSAALLALGLASLAWRRSAAIAQQVKM